MTFYPDTLHRKLLCNPRAYYSCLTDVLSHRPRNSKDSDECWNQFSRIPETARELTSCMKTPSETKHSLTCRAAKAVLWSPRRPATPPSSAQLRLLSAPSALSPRWSPPLPLRGGRGWVTLLLTSQTPRTHGSKRLGPPASADFLKILKNSVPSPAN